MPTFRVITEAFVKVTCTEVVEADSKLQAHEKVMNSIATGTPRTWENDRLTIETGDIEMPAVQSVEPIAVEDPTPEAA